MSKMGISTLQSYCGAQIFEAIGLDQDVRRSSTSPATASRIGGVGSRGDCPGSAPCGTRRASRRDAAPAADLDPGGEYQWRRQGEHHLVHSRSRPDAAARDRRAGDTRSTGSTPPSSTTRAVRLGTLRGLFEVRPEAEPVPLDRGRAGRMQSCGASATGAMSYGSISQEAHETLAIAMNRLGGRVEQRRRRRRPRAVHRAIRTATGARSAIKQVASGRFGVTS